MKKVEQSAPHYVTGHRTPDTDSLVGAHVFAWYLRETGCSSLAQAVRLGEPSSQAIWVFEQAGITIPPLREDCRYTVGDVMRQVDPIGPDEPLGKALDRIYKGMTDAVPVVENGELLGLISDRSAKTSYLIQCNVEEMLGSLITLESVVSGLDLEFLSPPEKHVAPDKLLFLDWEQGADNQPSFKSALVVAGNQPQAIRAAIEGGAAAIVIVGNYLPGEEVLASLEGPAFFRYNGSMGSFASRLTGCFCCSQAMEDHFPTLHPKQAVSEIRQSFTKLPYSLPVVDDDGVFVGMLSASTVLSLPPVRVSLIDHFERSQTIKGIDEAVITEIVDHHRIGDIESILPLRVDCRPVGSSATIIFERCRESDLIIPPAIAILLLGALVSDTLMLGSPTTTDTDRDAAHALSQISGLELETFGMEVLCQNDRSILDSPWQLVNQDSKVFQHGRIKFVAAQIETVDLSLMDESRRRELEHAFLDSCMVSDGNFGALMITDTICKDSHVILVSGSDFPLHTLIPEHTSPHSPSWLAKGWVSRKKQLIPYLLEKLDKGV